MTAIVLVGGEGRRLRDVAGRVPKPLIEVAGRPFLYWVTRWIEAQGERDIVLAACHLAEQVKVWAEKEGAARPGCHFSVSVEPTLLGTGGGIVYAASRHPADHYLAINGDSATFVSLKPARDWLRADAALDGIIIAKETSDTSRFGSLDIGSDGLLKGFREKQPGAGWINAGIYLLKRHLLAMDPKAMSIEFDCFPRWLTDGARIGVMAARADFLDIGTPETLAQASAFILANQECLDNLTKLAPVQRCA
ncbi:MAG: sugar phosphate nucleotidyltransferase [Rhizomicrobium sp.]